ncbi:hypothetical protein F511_03472 [Dorcoceras hygrometricum]|uniref:Uncharacterized protein n=1 Tax=Dorcoceras hygrometricum TaxID=472368 RepID=A0A2Z7AIK3_9LAMI|nr:hypothetical protein F511_03472 [Dorcoceras hygrometricum]
MVHGGPRRSHGGPRLGGRRLDLVVDILEGWLACAFVRRMPVHVALRSDHVAHGLSQDWSSWDRMDLRVVQPTGLRPWATGAGRLKGENNGCSGVDPVDFLPTGGEDL